MEKIHPDMGKLHKELMARPKLPDTSHGMFLKTAKYNKSLRKLTKAEEEALQQDGTVQRREDAAVEYE